LVGNDGEVVEGKEGRQSGNAGREKGRKRGGSIAVGGKSKM
jgi:hypothetical protein